MPTKVEELAAQRAALPPERLLPAVRLDEETRERYRALGSLHGTAYTKAEQLNLGEASHANRDLQVRTSS